MCSLGGAGFPSLAHACISRACVVKQKSLICRQRGQRYSYEPSEKLISRVPSSRTAPPCPDYASRQPRQGAGTGKGRAGRLGGPGGACVALPGRGGSARFGSARPGLAWLGSARLGPARLSLARFGSARGCPAPCGAGGRCPALRRRSHRCYAKARGVRILPGGTGARAGLGGSPDAGARAGARRWASGDTRCCRRERGSALGTRGVRRQLRSAGTREGRVRTVVCFAFERG